MLSHQQKAPQANAVLFSEPARSNVTSQKEYSAPKESVKSGIAGIDTPITLDVVAEVLPCEIAAPIPQTEGKWGCALRGVKNDCATIAELCAPWSFVPDVPSFADKDVYLKWRNKESTEHLLYSGVECQNVDLRANKKTNPVRRLLALVADYDADITEAMDDAVMRNAPADLRPSWISTTFSGGRRLVWLIDEPVPFDDIIAKRFFEVAGNELRVTSLLPGLDGPAWNSNQAYRLFDVGTKWERLSEKPLSSNTVHLWLFEAAKRTDWSKVGELHIPLADVEAQVHKQFPGRLDGSFELGGRCNVFWEPDGKNPSAAVVTENGMVAFSTGKLFYTWAEIFGAAFIKKYQADKIGAAIKDCWYDGRLYYRKIKSAWESENGEAFEKYLCSDHKLDGTRGKNETASETTQARVFIHNHRRIAGMIPSLFDRRDIVEINGKRFLNCARVKAIQPHEEPQTWAANFPWIARFLELRFDGVERPYFLGWWKRFYCSALQRELLKGHAVFIVGESNTGKTLLSDKLIGASVGGCADAAPNIISGSEFNRELFEVALVTVNDGELGNDPRSHARFSERTKSLVANPQQTWRAMYRDSQTITWNGRVLVTLNNDAVSLRLLPDLAISMEDKVTLLKFSNTPYSFPPQWELERMIAAELPSFLRYLVDWEIPESVKGENRFGLKSYINEELRIAALNAGQTGNVMEIIEIWKKRGGFEADKWIGTATEWFTLLAGDETLKPLVTKMTLRSIGKDLSAVSRIRDSGIEIIHESSRGNRYSIDVRLTTRKAVRIKPGATD
jgi:Family of unknown function (DUF5906)